LKLEVWPRIDHPYKLLRPVARKGADPRIGKETVKMAFNGFPPAFLEFFAGLEGDNSKAYWQARKDVYDAAVRAPAESLASDLGEEFGPVHLFRPYRDLRFTPDKRPYKENVAMSAYDGSGGGYYVSISTEGVHLGGGCWRPAPDQLERWRRAVDDPATAKALQEVLDHLAQAGLPFQSQEALKRMPRGYDADHPRADLLRLTSLTAGTSHELGPWLHDSRCLAQIQEDWRHLRLLDEWLGRHVGPSQAPDRGRRR
jgi:uncharacterized protein (TIGR02453 family)